MKMRSCMWILLVLLPFTAAVVPLTVKQLSDIVTHLRAYQQLLAVKQLPAGSAAKSSGVQTAATSPFSSLSSSVGIRLPAATVTPNVAIHTPSAPLTPTSSIFSPSGSITPTTAALGTAAATLPITSGQRTMLTSLASTTIARPPPTIVSPTSLPSPTPEVTTLAPVVSTESLPSVTATFESLENDLRKHLLLFHNHTDRYHQRAKVAGDEAAKLEYKALYVGGSQGSAYKLRAEGLREVEKFNVESFKTLMEVKKDMEEFMMGMNSRSQQIALMYPPPKPAPLPV